MTLKNFTIFLKTLGKKTISLTRKKKKPKNSKTEPTEALLVLVENDGKKCCLLVDELLGQQQVVIKSLGDGLGKVKGISGGAIMGDGKVSLILDVPSLMEGVVGM